MAYKRFGLLTVVRIIILFSVMGAEAYVLFNTSWTVTSILLAVLIVLLLLDLIRYLNKTNRDLSNFLESINHGDFTASFSAGRRGGTYNDLKDSFNGIITKFQELEAEKEVHHQYLQTVMEHIRVALICFRSDGEIILMNKAAQQLLSKPYMKRISALEKVDTALFNTVLKLESGERELIKLLIKGDLHQVAIDATEFKLMNKSYKLVSLHDIRAELDSRELEAWQKLIRVLTHEIMNSVTPVSTLSGVLRYIILDDKGKILEPKALSEEDLEDLATGLDTIANRTQGLLKFVGAYRSMLKIPKPVFRHVVVQDILMRIRTLLKADIENRGISLEMHVPPEDLSIQADPELIEMVLINLIKNAMEALGDTENAKIELIAARPKENKIILQVRDNGPGITDEFIEQIFVPFFTTKKEGSGIGLSLSRQIMRLHRGAIKVQTVPNEGTVFTLEF